MNAIQVTPPRRPARRRRGLSLWRRMRLRLRALGGLQRLVVGTGRWWLVPMVTVLGLTGIILMILALVEYAAPFVYTIF